MATGLAGMYRINPPHECNGHWLYIHLHAHANVHNEIGPYLCSNWGNNYALVYYSWNL